MKTHPVGTLLKASKDYLDSIPVRGGGLLQITGIDEPNQEYVVKIVG